MRIVTSEISLTKRDYLVLTTLLHVIRWWWTYMATLAASGWNLHQGRTPHAITFGVAAVVFLLMKIVQNTVLAFLPANRGFYLPHTMELDDNSITIRIRGGETSSIGWDSIFRVYRIPAYYVLYLSKSRFIVLPRRAFQTPDDAHTLDIFLKKS